MNNHSSLLKRWNYLLLLCFLSINQVIIAKGYTQDLSKTYLSVNFENVPLRTLLTTINRNTEFTVVYSANVAQLPDKFSIKDNKISFKSILDHIVEISDIQYQVNNKIVSVRKIEESTVRQSQQEKELSGQVTDDKGMPIPGANIFAEGTDIGTVTDFDGNFNLSVPENILEISVTYVGFERQDIIIGDQRELSIILTSDAASLEEVVITALNIKKSEESIGYATQQIEGNTLTAAQQPNVANNLNGKVAGLIVNNSTDLLGNSSIQLRGENPLIVIDGIPNEDASLYGIDAHNIENIDVLKGPSASALYGTLGRNGAIMITTKRGATDGDGISVEINSSLLFEYDFLRVPEKQNQYGSGRNGQYRYIDGSGQGIEGSGYTWGPRLDEKDPNTSSGFVEIPQFNSPVDPETGERIAIPWISRGENNMDNFFRNGIINSNSVSVTSGNIDRNIRVALSNKYQKGTVPNTSLNSYFATLSGSYTYKDFEFDASFNYSRQLSDNVPEINWSSQSVIYNVGLYMGSNIDVRDLKDYWVEGQEGFQQRHYSGRFYNNPYFITHEFNQGYNKDQTNGQLSLTYNIEDNLSVLARSGFNYFGEIRTEEEPKSFIRDFRMGYGDYRINNQNNFNITTDILINYDTQLSEELELNAKVGVSNYYHSQRNSFLATDGLEVPNLYNISNSSNALRGSNRFAEYKKNSVYGIINLNYSNVLYLELAGRNDWVSTLPLDNNSFFYPSVTGSFVLSHLLELPKPISYVKFRGGWAEVSNGDLGSPYDHLQTYNSGINWQNNSSLVFPGNLISPDLKPETSSSFETGLDIRFFQSRLGLDVTYFSNREFNNIVTVPISESSGYSGRFTNANEYRKQGVEFILNAHAIKTNNFDWRLLFNASRNITRIKQIDNGDRLGYREEGDRIDDMYHEVWMESPDGQFVIGENGMNIRDPYQRYIGHSGHNWALGLQNTFRYKNFQLSIGIDGRLGGTFESKTIRNMYQTGMHPDLVGEDRYNSTQGEASYVAPGVVVESGTVEYDVDGNIVNDTRQFIQNTTPVNYETYMFSYWSQSFGNNSYFSKSFIKLREVGLSYEFSNRLLDNTPLEQASLGLVARNLLMWADVDYIDPDTGSDLQLQTPPMRSIGLNLNLKF